MPDLMDDLMKATRDMVTTRGEEFETPYTDDEAANIVAENADHVDRFFAELAEDHLSGETLSDRQLPYLHKGALQAESEWNDSDGENEVIEGLSPIVGHFDSAHENGLQYPSITIKANAPDPGVRMYRAGQKSSRPGSVAVTDADGDDFWGRIRRDGTFRARDAAPDWLQYVLEDFEARPEDVAREEGQATGACCFCNTKLTEEGSVRVGYGPVCAQNFGLPHPQN